MRDGEEEEEGGRQTAKTVRRVPTTGLVPAKHSGSASLQTFQEEQVSLRGDERSADKGPGQSGVYGEA